jgi:hypothetical protein
MTDDLTLQTKIDAWLATQGFDEAMRSSQNDTTGAYTVTVMRDDDGYFIASIGSAMPWPTVDDGFTAQELKLRAP